MFSRSFLTAALVGSLATTASAGTVVSVALSSTDTGIPTAVTDAGVLGDVGDSWNLIPDNATAPSRAVPSSTGNALLDGSGNATSYTLDVSEGWGGHDGDNDEDGTSIGPLINSWFVGAGGNGADGWAGTAFDNPTLTVNGFNPGDIVDLAVFTTFHFPAGGASGFNRGTEVTVNGNTETSTGSSGTAASYVLNENYVSFSGLVVDGSGSLVLNFAPNAATGDFFDVNGLQFSVVPEPSSLALIGLGGLAILRRRRA
ncbi:MAG: PEP-CTERM sorting domain-containing protein [Phycisphaeraceae bacterium]|nr:PEP-CTERM sorting domain-containing protein [Phycisphaeraceae bacterium]